VPQDLGSSQLVGINGPSYVTPTLDGYVVPADVFASQVPAQHRVGGASAYPSAASHTADVNGVQTPIGLTETFTTDAQGRTTMNENVQAYVGFTLPTGTVTASGGATITAKDITYPPGGMSPDEFLGVYAPDALRQQQLGVTLASYAAEFSSPPPEKRPDVRQPTIPAFAEGGSFAGGGPILVGERGPEVIVPGGPGTVIPHSALTPGTASTTAPKVGTEPITEAFTRGGAYTSAAITAAFQEGAASTSASLSKSSDKLGSTLTSALAAGAVLFSGLFKPAGGAAGGASNASSWISKIFGAGGSEAGIAQTGAAATGTDLGALADTIPLFVAAGGGPIPANQLTLVGERGPELFVSDLGETTAATATRSGTVIPNDLTHAHVIGTDGPEYIRPNVSGFVVPSDTLLRAINDRTAPQAPAPIAARPDISAEADTPDDGGRRTAPNGGFPTVSADRVVPESLRLPGPDARAEASALGIPQTATGGVRPLASVVDLTPLIAARLPAREEPLFGQPETTLAETPAPHEQLLGNAAPPVRTTAESRGTPSIEREPASNVIAFATPASPASDRALASPPPELLPVPDRSASEATRVETPELPPTNVIAFPASSSQPRATAEREFALANVLPPIPEQPDVGVPGPSSTNVIAFPQPSLPSSGHAFAATMLDAASALPPAPDRLDSEVTRADAPEIPAQLDQPTSTLIVKFEKIVKHEQSPMLDAHAYEALLTDRYLQKRQAGGSVSAGKPYLVGEGGPELMVPDSSGMVMNSWDTQSSRSTVVHQYLNFTVNTPSGKVDRASQGQIAARTLAAAQAAGGRNN
jgi:hypothetical protein